MVEEQNKFVIKWWEKSLFFLITQELKNALANLDIPEPNNSYRWYTDFPLATLEIEPDDGPLEPSFFEPNFDQVQSDQKTWIEKLEKAGGKIVAPDKARYMIAVIDKDPFPSTLQDSFHCKDLYYMEIIPSPILPPSRHLLFTICWLIESEFGDIDNIRSDIIALSNEQFQVYFNFDENTLSHKKFIIIDIQPYITNFYAPSRQILEELQPTLKSFLMRIEDVLKNSIEIKRSTENYWDKEIFMKFRHD
jgi:hypothetical protein